MLTHFIHKCPQIFYIYYVAVKVIPNIIFCAYGFTDEKVSWSIIKLYMKWKSGL